MTVSLTFFACCSLVRPRADPVLCPSVLKMTLPITMSYRRRRTNDNLEKRGSYIHFERAEKCFWVVSLPVCASDVTKTQQRLSYHNLSVCDDTGKWVN